VIYIANSVPITFVIVPRFGYEYISVPDFVQISGNFVFHREIFDPKVRTMWDSYVMERLHSSLLLVVRCSFTTRKSWN
jgi:hypothetical protein